jgi:hypothetical protein
MKRFLCLGLVLFLYITISGCGNTFRPIIIPNPPTFPNPAAAHTVVSINDNGALVAGSAMVIDVSGDSVSSIANTDIHPIFAAQQSAGEILVLNQAVTGPEFPLGVGVPTSTCLVTVPQLPPPTPPPDVLLDVCPTITVLNFASTSIGSTTTITLPIYSSPNFVAVAPSATTAYVTLPTYPPNPDAPFPQTIVPSVGVINLGATSKSLVGTVPVVASPPAGANPYALAVTPDNTKLYVANNSTCSSPSVAGMCSISAFNTNNTDFSLSTRGVTGSLTSPPIWLSARSDSQAVYALEASGTLAYISIASTTGPDVVTEEPSISLPGAVKMVYDGNLNELYIPGGSQVAIVDVSQSVPAPLATVTITAVAPASRSAADPCAATTVTTLNTVDVAALPDNSRAYAGTYYEAAVGGVSYICPQVTVINATSNTAELPVIAIPGFPAYEPFCTNARFRLTMASGGDSTRAYLASCDGGMVNIIDTSTDSYIENQPVPAGTGSGSGSQNVPQNPVFLLDGP